eukprot:6254494-Amphidinium_carterae.1
MFTEKQIIDMLKQRPLARVLEPALKTDLGAAYNEMSGYYPQVSNTVPPEKRGLTRVACVELA